MLLTPTNLRITRRISLTPGSSFAVEEVEGPWFRGDILPPDDRTSAFPEGPPRELPHWTARWLGGSLGPGDDAPTRPSERIESPDAEYETLGIPRELHSGRRLIGHEVAVMKVNDLYPYRGTLQEQGGDEVTLSMPFALWDPDDVRTGSGQYTIYQAEAPAEYAADLTVKNRQLYFNGIAFRIVDPYLVLQVPRIRFIMRGAR